MKRVEQRFRERCEGCGRAIVSGAIFRVLAELEGEGAGRKVYGLHPVSVEEAEACYVGCVIEEGVRCPACGVGVVWAVEVEYSDTCELCGGVPAGREWYWDEARRCNVGLCERCEASERGRAWVDSR